MFFNVGVLDFKYNFQPEFTLTVYRNLIEHTIRLNGDCTIYLIMPVLSTSGGVWGRLYDVQQGILEIVEYVEKKYPNSTIHLIDLFGRMYQEGGSVAGYNAFMLDPTHLNETGHQLLADIIHD